MILRNVQRVEVVEVGFDLAAVFDRISERNENIFDSLTQESDRMAMSVRGRRPGQSDVDAFARGACFFDVTA
jgi:hypothetical protein